MKKILLTASLLALIGGVSLGCAAKEGAESVSPAVPPTPEEMAKIMREAGQPGEQHMKLAPLAGNWKAESSWRMSPQMPFEVSSATSEKKWVLNGLYIQEHYDDKNPKQPFKGIGMIGYDKVADNFTSTWFDTMSSSTWRSTGEMAQNKIIKFSGGGFCPMTGDYKEVSSELQIVSPNKHILRMYDQAPNGERYKSLEIVYTRS